MGCCWSLSSSSSNKLELSVENVEKFKTMYTLENRNINKLKTLEKWNKSQTLRKQNQFNDNNDNYSDHHHCNHHHCNYHDDDCGGSGGS